MSEMTVWQFVIHLADTSQGLAAWVGAIGALVSAIAALLALFVIWSQLRAMSRQARQMQNQVNVMLSQVQEMRDTRDLEAFESFFLKIWETDEVREARKRLYAIYLQKLKDKQGDELIREVRQIAYSTADRSAFELVINRGNLAGTLWAKEFFSKTMRQRIVRYIHKTVIVSWDCAKPYIDFVREKREKDKGSITYAAPFEELLRVAETELGDEPRPQPTEF